MVPHSSGTSHWAVVRDGSAVAVVTLNRNGSSCKITFGVAFKDLCAGAANESWCRV